MTVARVAGGREADGQEGARRPASGPAGGPRLPDRTSLLRPAISLAARSLRARIRGLLGVLRIPRSPDRLLFAPQDLRAADPAIADEMSNGLFVLGGVAMELRITPFAVASAPPEWTDELYGLAWLRHLRAADDAASRKLARDLVGGLVSGSRARLRGGRGAAPRIVARRVTSILAHSPLLLPGASPVFFRRLLAALGRDVARLEREMRAAPLPRDRLAAAIAFCTAGLCCGGLEGRMRRQGARTLVAELERQITPDGVHLSRNPGEIVELLLDLLPLRRLYVSRGGEAPKALDDALDRMLPMLRLLRHPGGDLALFNGMGRTEAGEAASLLALVATDAAPAAPSSGAGFHRLEAGPTVVLVDAGEAPLLEAATAAGAGCLSFELSAGRERLVVNRGAPSRDGPERLASRATAAHSTLELGGVSSAAILDPATAAASGGAARFLAHRLGPALAGGRATVGSERGRDRDGATILTARFEGYAAPFGASHTRRLRLAPAGDRLDGLDTVAIQPGRGGASRAARLPAAIRFHLHPSVRVGRSDDARSVHLLLADGQLWAFDCDEISPAVAADVFHAVPEDRRATHQIVLAFEISGPDARVSVAWRFRRLPSETPEPADVGKPAKPGRTGDVPEAEGP